VEIPGNDLSYWVFSGLLLFYHRMELSLSVLYTGFNKKDFEPID